MAVNFSVTLAGLVRISRIRYLCKDLSFLNSLLTNLITITEKNYAGLQINNLHSSLLT